MVFAIIWQRCHYWAPGEGCIICLQGSGSRLQQHTGWRVVQPARAWGLEGLNRQTEAALCCLLASLQLGLTPSKPQVLGRP